MLDLAALLADRAALVAEVARLQAQLDSAHQMLGEVADELTRVEDQSLEMRPLVEAVANSHASNLSDGMRSVTMPGASVDKARALVAAWQTPAAPDTNRQRYPHFGLVWTVIDAVAAGDNERARAYADLLADHLDADYPYEAKRIRNRLSPDYDPGPLLYLMAETPAAPTPDGREGDDDVDA